MRCLGLLLAVGLFACASRTPPKEGHVTSWTHPEYTEMRPVVIAVLPGIGKAKRVGVRNHVQDGLIGKRYSPIKTTVVDALVDDDGKFAAKDVDWDATMELRVDRWKSYRDGLFRANASAVLVHRTGEKIWSCEVEDYPLRGDPDASSELLGEVFLGHLPFAPPPK